MEQKPIIVRQRGCIYFYENKEALVRGEWYGWRNDASVAPWRIKILSWLAIAAFYPLVWLMDWRGRLKSRQKNS